MNLKAKYKENQLLIARYRDYLKSREIDSKVRKSAWMIKERDELDENELIIEMAQLCEENKLIWNQGIENLTTLDNVYTTDTNIVSSQFDNTH